jgi:hypothetical protein
MKARSSFLLVRGGRPGCRQPGHGDEIDTGLLQDVDESPLPRQRQSIAPREIHVLGRIRRCAHAELVEEDPERVRSDQDGSRPEDTRVVERRQRCVSLPVGDCITASSEQTYAPDGCRGLGDASLDRCRLGVRRSVTYRTGDVLLAFLPGAIVVLASVERIVRRLLPRRERTRRADENFGLGDRIAFDFLEENLERLFVRRVGLDQSGILQS